MMQAKGATHHDTNMFNPSSQHCLRRSHKWRIVQKTYTKLQDILGTPILKTVVARGRNNEREDRHLQEAASLTLMTAMNYPAGKE